MTALTMGQKEELRSALRRKRSQVGLLPFLDEVDIELANKDVRPFRTVREPFQEALIAPLVPAIESACGLTTGYTGPRKFYYTLHKSAAKTSLIGMLATFCVSFAPKHTRLMAAAADQKQSGFLLEAVKMVRRENEWLHPCMNIVQYSAKGPGGLLTIESSEAYTKSGVLADILILDELCFWSDTRGKELYDTLEAATVKRPHTVFIIITNAGIIDTYQWNILQNAMRDPNTWVVDNTPGVRASWLTPAAIASATENMLPSMARRMFQNEWVQPFDLEDSYLQRHQVEDCVDPAREWQLQGA